MSEPREIMNIATSPDPMGTFLTQEGQRAGSGAAQALTGVAGEALPALPRIAQTAGRVGENVVKDIPIVRGVTPGKIAEAWKSTAPAPAEPVYPGARLPARPGPGQLPYENVDFLRSKIASPEAIAAKEYDLQGLKPEALQKPTEEAVSQGRAAAIPVKQPTPAELAIKEGRAAEIPVRVKPKAKPVETKPSAPSPEVRVSKAPDIAKVEAKPSAKPVEAKTAAARREDYLFGEHSSKYDPENLAHRKIKDMTHEELAGAANERKLDGRSDWKADDFKRTEASHGKHSSTPAKRVRGILLDEANVKPVSGGSTPQGGHAGGGVTSVEEIARPGSNYLVNRGGGLTYHGKSFAPEETPTGGAHVTVLPSGELRVNAGDLTPEMKKSLLKGLK